MLKRKENKKRSITRTLRRWLESGNERSGRLFADALYQPNPDSCRCVFWKPALHIRIHRRWHCGTSENTTALNRLLVESRVCNMRRKKYAGFMESPKWICLLKELNLGPRDSYWDIPNSNCTPRYVGTEKGLLKPVQWRQNYGEYIRFILKEGLARREQNSNSYSHGTQRSCYHGGALPAAMSGRSRPRYSAGFGPVLIYGSSFQRQQESIRNNAQKSQTSSPAHVRQYATGAKAAPTSLWRGNSLLLVYCEME
jgi:hypothetical protein